jgi:hypothetical protein
MQIKVPDASASRLVELELKLFNDIGSEHPSYAGCRSLWGALKSLARANFDSAAYWLPRRVGEETEIYASRLNKLTYNPVYVQCLLALKKGINKGALTVKGSDIAPSFLIALAGEIAINLANYGSLWLSFDADGTPYQLEPDVICDWYSSGGVLQWVKSHTYERVHTDPTKPAELFERYQVWTQTETYVYQSDGVNFNLISQESIDSLPFVRLELPAEQWLGKICYTKLRQLIGVESSLSEASANLYIQRTVENTTPLPDDDLTDTYSNARPDAIYTSNAYIVSGRFSFAEATGTSITKNLEMVKVIEQQIRALVGLDAMYNSGANESGESKRYDFKDYSDVLSSLGSPIVKAFSELLSIYHKRDVEISGLDEFELDNLRSMLDIEPAVSLASDKITPAYITAWYEKLGSALSPNITS